jgi:hypothetical protein
VLGRVRAPHWLPENDLLRGGGVWLARSTEADPKVLSQYVLSLLKTGKPTEELQQTMISNLKEFLADSASLGR